MHLMFHINTVQYDAQVRGTIPVLLNLVVLLEDANKVIGVFLPHVLHAKVIDT